MDRHSGSHHVLLQTCHRQVWSVGPADTCGWFCAQGKNRVWFFFFFLSDKLFDPCRWVSEPEAFHFLLWKHVTNKPVGCEPMFYNRPLQYLPPSLPADCFAPPALTWAPQFKLHISYFPNPSRRYSIRPWGELSPSSPCQRRTHTHTHTHRQDHYSLSTTGSDSYLWSRGWKETFRT